jgi:hypothetical protein
VIPGGLCVSAVVPSRVLRALVLGVLSVGGVCLIGGAAASSSEAAVVTYGGNSGRDGLYTSMHRLSPSLVSSRRFGRLFDTALPDHAQVYGQPLLAGGRLVVATERNDLYELDPRTGRILRSRALAAPWDSVFPSRYRCPDLQPAVGVTSTPVIDTARGVIYVTAKTAVPASQATVFNQAAYLVYALRLSDLRDAPGFGGGHPVSLSGLSPPGEPSLRFDPTFQVQRPALLETRGTIFAGFGGLCDTSPYLGWVFGVRASDGAVTGRWATPTAPGARGAGIWMAGAGLASDGPGRIFFATGNGFDAPGSNGLHTPVVPAPGNRPPSGLASSVVRLRLLSGGGLTAADFFTPCNARTLDGGPNLDLDVSSGGVAVLPPSFGRAAHRRLLLAGGKSGTLYVLDRRHLGGFRQGAPSRGCSGGGDATAATLARGGAIWGASAVWPGDGGWLIVPTESPGASNSPSRGSLEFFHGRLGTLRLAARTAAVWGAGSGSPVVTSIGMRSGSALVWGVSRGVGSPQLRAFSIPSRGRSPVQLASFPVGAVTKFAPPGVGPDEIFVGGDGHVVGFGARRR